jgi:ElaB/YqjD/DUF883 family membrane-anchored ribosome-binding protein
MDPQPDVIHKQIEETRSSLTEKLETLEAEVKGTVQTAKETVESAKEAVEETFTTAKETVQETISTVKETVNNAKETVKRTFDLEYQVDRHPWAMLGLSFASGIALGAFLGGRLSRDSGMARHMSEASRVPPERGESTPAAAWARLTHEEPARPGFMDKLSSQLGGEMEKVKDLAISTLVGVVGDVARRSLPALANTVEEMMANAASQFAHPQQNGPRRAASAGSTDYGLPPVT